MEPARTSRMPGPSPAILLLASAVAAGALVLSRPVVAFAFSPLAQIASTPYHRRSIRTSKPRHRSLFSAGADVADGGGALPPPAAVQSNRPALYTPTQSEAVRSVVGYYTVPAAQRDEVGGTSTPVVVRWHAMSRECPELLGIPPSSVREIFLRSGAPGASDVPPVRPLIDSYEFLPGDRIAGTCYGLRGVADGSGVTTPPLTALGRSAGLGFLAYEDEDTGEAVVYELGRAAEKIASTAGEGGGGTLAAETAWDVTKGAAETVLAVGEGLDLVKLGGLAAMVLGGSTALSMIGHHLTVNVFWV